MNTSQLRRVASRHRRVGPVFAGVFASDELPKKATNKAYIINLDPSNKRGSHWISIYFHPEKNAATYFDPYGLKPKSLNIIRFLRRNAMFKTYNRKVYQSPCSFVCGEYALYHLYHQANGLPLSVLDRHFHPMTKRNNDRKVVRFVKKHFNGHTEHPYVDQNCLNQTSQALLA